MRYQISGKQIDIGEALQTHVKNEMGIVMAKYAQRPTDATVVFSKSAHEFVCEATPTSLRQRTSTAGTTMAWNSCLAWTRCGTSWKSRKTCRIRRGKSSNANRRPSTKPGRRERSGRTSRSSSSSKRNIRTKFWNRNLLRSSTTALRMWSHVSYGRVAKAGEGDAGAKEAIRRFAVLLLHYESSEEGDSNGT